MKLTAPILAAVALAAGLSGCGSTVTIQQAAAVKTAVPATSPTGPTVTVAGSGSAAGTPDQASMSFGVNSSASSAASALSDETSAARRLISALKNAGIAAADIQTQYLSLYRDQQRGVFNASSSVSAKIRDLSRAGSIIDASVAAAGDSIQVSGISLSIADTGSLMAAARKDAISDAGSRARQYAQAAGLKVGGIVSISETANSPGPVYYGAAGLAAAGQPIEPGQQTLSVSVTVVYQLTQ